MSCCNNCGREFHRQELAWVKDRYGIPYKLCCPKCFSKCETEISAWRFDAAYAGEALEPEE